MPSRTSLNAKRNAASRTTDPNAFRACLELACAVTGMRAALIGAVTDTDWTAEHALDRAGLHIVQGMKLELAKTFCLDVTRNEEAIWFSDYETHAQHCTSLIPPMYGFRSYISVPVALADGSIFGTLCTLDPEARTVTDDILQSMHRLAGVVAGLIDSERSTVQNALVEPASARMEHQLRAAQLANEELKQESRLREEFIAVLAHDLRNPLQTIRVTSELLSLTGTTPAQNNLLKHLDDSAERMAELIDVTMDFARARLGSGLALRQQPWSDLAGALQRAATDALAPYADATLQVDLQLPTVVVCDADRLAQLVANLIINAAIHGTTGVPIVLRGHADTQARTLEISVANAGQISPASMEGLFQPFHRSAEQRLQAGLGLGLYIASQIAQSHGGTLTAVSNAIDGTVFTLRMPLAGTR